LSSPGNRALLMKSPWSMRFFDEIALPSGVMGPRERLPLARDALILASELIFDLDYAGWVGKRGFSGIGGRGGYVFRGHGVRVWKRFLKIVVTVYRPIRKRQGFASNVFLFQGVCYSSAGLAGRAIGRPGALGTGSPPFLSHRSAREARGWPSRTCGMPGAGRRLYLKGGSAGASGLPTCHPAPSWAKAGARKKRSGHASLRAPGYHAFREQPRWRRA
jgi:hypothetical protein